MAIPDIKFGKDLHHCVSAAYSLPYYITFHDRTMISAYPVKKPDHIYLYKF